MTQPGVQPPTMYVPPVQPGYEAYYGPARKKFPWFGTLSVWFGALSLLLAWTGFGLVATIVALIMGFMGRSREPESKGLSLTGIILAFSGLAIALIVWMIFLLIGGSLLAGLSSGSGS